MSLSLLNPGNSYMSVVYIIVHYGKDQLPVQRTCSKYVLTYLYEQDRVHETCSGFE